MRKIKQTERAYVIRFDGRLYDSATTLEHAIERIARRHCQSAEVYLRGKLVHSTKALNQRDTTRDSCATCIWFRGL